MLTKATRKQPAPPILNTPSTATENNYWATPKVNKMSTVMFHKARAYWLLEALATDRKNCLDTFLQCIQISSHYNVYPKLMCQLYVKKKKSV